MPQQLPRIDSFTDFWRLYQSTPPRDLITTNVVVKGRVMGIVHALGKFFYDTDYLDDATRKSVLAELNRFRPAMMEMGGGKETDPSYWRERMWRVSQAARALKPLIERKAVLPDRYTPPPG